MPGDELEHTIRVSSRTLEALNAAKTGNKRHDDIIQQALRTGDLSRPDPVDVLEGGAT
jgi:hypothetical protein